MERDPRLGHAERARCLRGHRSRRREQASQGAPGKKSAIIGAWLALVAAMTAQGLSHAIVTGHLPIQPLVPLWSCWPYRLSRPSVFGHLLHLAATPVARAAEQPQVAPETSAVFAAPPRRAWPGAPAGARLLPRPPLLSNFMSRSGAD